CSALATVTLNNNALVSKEYTSSNNFKSIFGAQVKKYVLGKAVKEIGQYAFSGCTSLTSVTIPESVSSIGDSSFSGCTSLTSVIVKREVPADYNCVMSAFSADTYNTATLQVPAGSGKAYLQCKPWSKFATIKDGSATYNGSGDDAAVEAGICPDIRHPHQIDMGAAGKWACCNVGASTPFEYGGYYAWGEKVEKSDYSSENYTVTFNEDFSGNELYDVATAKWGYMWKMPTRDGIKALLNCSNKWTTIDNVNGRLFTAANGNRIFLPAAGCRKGTSFFDIAGSNGNYWSSTPPYSLYFHSGGVYPDNFNVKRYFGLPVRPVAE
ncbi:MAG: leucine-rich repeat protein, partial [Alloprevotella sp.]|nr:leucine-rich repeat protein [Alloprevotella sp.]